MRKKLFYLSMISIFILALVSYPWHTRYLFDLSDMDLSLDFALVDGNLVFCAKDGIYCVDVSNPENRQCLVPYPQSYVENIPATGEPFVYMENDHGNVTVSYSIFHHLAPTTMLLNRAITTDQPTLQAVVGDGMGCYREFERHTVFASWPQYTSAASAIWVTDENGNHQCLFCQPPLVSPINPLARVPVCSNTATGYIALSAGKRNLCRPICINWIA